jgi:DNA-binding NarL/FixJ family response regulator
MQQDIEATVTVIAIVPNWLQEPLSVLLEASIDVKVIGSASSLEELPSLEGNQSPDLVFAYADGGDAAAAEQIGQLKAHWPKAHLIALVEHSGQRDLAEAAGANQVVLKGVSPGKLLEMIEEAHTASRGLGAADPQAGDR